MFCPKCKYTTFDYFKRCPRCDYDWSEIKKQLGLDWIAEQEVVEQEVYEETMDNSKGDIGEPQKKQAPEIEPPVIDNKNNHEVGDETTPQEPSSNIEKEIDEEIELDKDFFIEIEKGVEKEIVLQEKDDLPTQEISAEVEPISLDTKEEVGATKSPSENEQGKIEQDVWDIEFEDLVLEDNDTQKVDEEKKDDIDMLLFVEEDKDKKNK